MPVHFLQPFSKEKNLGKVYNETMAMIPEGHHVCFRDIDTLFLTPNTPNIILDYIDHYPDVVLTCYTNRISPLSRKQLFQQQVSENSDIIHHIDIAERQEQVVSVSRVHHTISGFLMVFSKELWKQFPFKETGQCLGIDTEWSRRLLNAGIQILRMNGIYVFHTYRLKNGITYKAHLQ